MSYIIKAFSWSFASKIIDSLIKFVSVPLLLTYFGKLEYGLLSLAISINAYLQLLDMGVNTGAIKYFSEWLERGMREEVNTVARTSITFYGLIGFVNSIFLVLVAYFGLGVFSLSFSQQELFKSILLLLAGFSIINWATSVFNQLLIADGEIAFIQKINLFKSIINLIIVYLTIQLNWSLLTYFFWYTFVNSITLIPFYILSKRKFLIKSILPGTNWTGFKQILAYSMSILAIAIFQMSAVKLRPIVLSIFSNGGVHLVADFRILETITIFVISIGGSFITIFLPKASRLIVNKDQQKIEDFVYNGTLYTSIICTFLCVPFILCAEEVLEIYVGEEYVYLSNWLVLWVLTILFYLHNSPVSSLVLSTGKTKMLVYSSAFSCIISLVINALYAQKLGIGAAIIGYTIYIAIQMSFYYFYFNTKILKLNSLTIFVSFLKPAGIGLIVAGVVYLINFEPMDSILINVFLKLFLWIIIYVTALIVLRIIDLKVLLKEFSKNK